MTVHDPAAGLAARWPGLRALWRGGEGAQPLSREETARVVAGIARLSAGLTRERALVGERYLDDPELLGAYLLFYWPISYAQARSVLGELGARPLGRTLDVGAGPLPMGLAAIDAGAGELVAVDRVERALALGRRLGGAAAITTSPWDPERGDALPQGPFDTIVAGHVLTELYLGPRALDRRAQLVKTLLGRLAPGGRLVLVEPALRETSRALLSLRDRVVAEGATVLAPCLLQAGCPALVRESDWCHAERAWSPPEELVALAEAARLHKERLKMSYLILSPSGPASTDDPRRFRIVSEPLPQKGKRISFGCGLSGRHPLVRRERDDEGELMASLGRGDLVRVERVVPRGDGLRIESGVTVERLAPAGAPPPEEA